MKKALVFWFMFWGLLALAYGQNEFEKNVYVTASGDSLNYRLLRPEIEKEGEKYPLVLFLHGAGERGSFISEFYKFCVSFGAITTSRTTVLLS